MAGLTAARTAAGEAAERGLDHERREVAGAIALVAEAGFPSVIIANLAHSQLVAEEFRPLADAMGVRLELLGHEAGSGCDVAVRRQ
jgi:hypothetical protein